MTTEDPVYIKGTPELAEINGAIGYIWANLDGDPTYESLAVNYPALAGLEFDGECPFLLYPKSAGIDHSMAANGLQVITGLTKDALIALFKQAIFPKLKKRVGVGALEESRPPPG